MLLRLSPHLVSHRPPHTARFVMLSSNPHSPNASGLSSIETRSLNERTAEPHEERIFQAIKELYSCKPSEASYEIYVPDAVFHDPIGIAEGTQAIRAQFNGLVKIFPRADLTKFRILQNPPSIPPTTILIDQDVAYFRDPKAETPTKTVNSLLTLQTNDEHQVTGHTEEWDHKRETTGEDGFFGMLNEQRKKLTAAITGKFVSQEPPASSNNS